MTLNDGQRIILQDKDWIYLSGAGASPKGDRPFLDKMNLKTGEKVRLFQCVDGKYQSFVGFAGRDRDDDHHQPGIEDRSPELSPCDAEDQEDRSP